MADKKAQKQPTPLESDWTPEQALRGKVNWKEAMRATDLTRAQKIPELIPGFTVPQIEYGEVPNQDWQGYYENGKVRIRPDARDDAGVLTHELGHSMYAQDLTDQERMGWKNLHESYTRPGEDPMTRALRDVIGYPSTVRPRSVARYSDDPSHSFAESVANYATGRHDVDTDAVRRYIGQVMAAHDPRYITPPLPSGYSPTMTVGGRRGRFNFDKPPETGGTPFPRYAFETDDGGQWNFQLEKEAQGGRWEDAHHAESDYARYRRMSPRERRAELTEAWGDDPIGSTIYDSATRGEPWATAKARLQPYNTWRQISNWKTQPPNRR